MTIFAAIQITSNDEMDKNLEKSFFYIDEAIKNNAKVICLPEVFT